METITPTKTTEDGTNALEASRESDKRRQRRHKARKLKKVLRDRLNIDCLRMLSYQDDDYESPFKQPVVADPNPE